MKSAKGPSSHHGEASGSVDALGANRKRDRQRQEFGISSRPAAKTIAPHLKAQLHTTRRRLQAESASCQQQCELLLCKVRFQAGWKLTG